VTDEADVALREGSTAVVGSSVSYRVCFYVLGPITGCGTGQYQRYQVKATGLAIAEVNTVVRVIIAIPAAYFAPFRPPISEQSGHLFRSIPATVSRIAVPVQLERLIESPLFGVRRTQLILFVGRLFANINKGPKVVVEHSFEQVFTSG